MSLALAAGSTGCMAISATEHCHGVRSDRQVVEAGGRVYVVNSCSGKAWEVDLSKAEPMPVCEEKKGEHKDGEP